MPQPDFTTVTEITGYKVTKEQIQRMYTRYRFAADYCAGKDVLEAACGSGQGLGLLAGKAKKVVGADIDENNLKFARECYKDRKNIELKVIDVHRLPFPDGSFDVVILYEAIYYLAEPEKFLREARRVLGAGGVLIICSANKDLPDFNPSPYSHRYFSAPELAALIGGEGFTDVAMYGDSAAARKTIKGKALSLIKKAAVATHLVPKTMKGKEFLKRIVFGELKPLPSEIQDNTAEYIAPQNIASDVQNHEYKVLFAVGHK